MSSPPAKIPALFLGATGASQDRFSHTYCNQFLSVLWIGYLGGALVSRILTTDLFAHKFDITVLVRSTEKAHRLESEHNVKACIGSLEDIDTVEQLAQQSHVVWSMVREHVLYQLILLQR